MTRRTAVTNPPPGRSVDPFFPSHGTALHCTEGRKIDRSSKRKEEEREKKNITKTTTDFGSITHKRIECNKQFSKMLLKGKKKRR